MKRNCTIISTQKKIWWNLKPTDDKNSQQTRDRKRKKKQIHFFFLKKKNVFTYIGVSHVCRKGEAIYKMSYCSEWDHSRLWKLPWTQGKKQQWDPVLPVPPTSSPAVHDFSPHATWQQCLFPPEAFRLAVPPAKDPLPPGPPPQHSRLS